MEPPKELSTETLPFTLETELERQIGADAAWQQGVWWGVPRFGHREGKVAYHIAEVLANVDRHALDPDDRRNLRLITLIHDTFKYHVDETQPKTGENHHGMIARRFAESYLQTPALLEIIELHDEAYNSWSIGYYRHNWPKAEARAKTLIARLGDLLPLYLRFYHADNETDSKDQSPLIWFKQLVAAQNNPPHSNLSQRNPPETSQT